MGSKFFPASQQFDEKQQEWFDFLDISTNAKENVGKQFQESFLTGEQKLSLNDTTDCWFQFVDCFEKIDVGTHVAYKQNMV